MLALGRSEKIMYLGPYSEKQISSVFSLPTNVRLIRGRSRLKVYHHQGQIRIRPGTALVELPFIRWLNPCPWGCNVR